jgi:putative pyruvate formate lyase activating enzyme
MKKTNQNLNPKKRTSSFQSDIVIDENGEIFISFFPPELLHLVSKKQIPSNLSPSWIQPHYSPDELRFLDKEEYSSCNLCPKTCGFDRVKQSHPLCGDWNLKVSNYGVSFGDEAVLSNGGGSGVIFISGCHLTCPSCINPEKVRSDNSIVSVQEFLNIAEMLYLKGVNNIQILSPTINLPHIRHVLNLLKKYHFPLPIVLKSSGYESIEEIKKLKGLVDIYVPDYKFQSSHFWTTKSGARDYHNIFIPCLEEMYHQVGEAKFNQEGNIEKGVIIRHVKNPYLSSIENDSIDKFLNSQKKDIVISILNNFVVLD